MNALTITLRDNEVEEAHTGYVLMLCQKTIQTEVSKRPKRSGSQGRRSVSKSPGGGKQKRTVILPQAVADHQQG